MRKAGHTVVEFSKVQDLHFFFFPSVSRSPFLVHVLLLPAAFRGLHICIDSALPSRAPGTHSGRPADSSGCIIVRPSEHRRQFYPTVCRRLPPSWRWHIVACTERSDANERARHARDRVSGVLFGTAIPTPGRFGPRWNRRGGAPVLYLA